MHRDQEVSWRLAEVTRMYDAAVASASASTHGVSEQLADVRWMIEELRVSMYAQQLGTARTVSEKRVLKAITAAAPPPR